MSRDTKTGGVLEAMILPSLKNGGYEHMSQVLVGKRIGGGRHVVDVLAEKTGKKYLVSLKWQQVGGTAEQKVPFEVICLTQAVIESKEEYSKAYLVLGGNGWKLRDFYTGGGLEKFLEYKDKVEIVTLESFVALANQSKL
ncbi:MAG TPA: PD-(D/E)XK nuclease superfamily protein [Candidatus Paceibacterota bacterium]